MEYSFGTIKVKAEIRDDSERSIENFRDVTAKYSELSSEQKEHLYAVFLQNDNEEIGDKLIGLGGNGSVQFDMQDIARTAVLVNAAAVILIHNHPSGTAEATPEDISTTNEVYDILETLGIQLLDHVIIARDGNYSMAARGQGPF